jgi:hypothetical protein
VKVTNKYGNIKEVNKHSINAIGVSMKTKPQGKGIVKALGQKSTTGNFKKIQAAKGKGAAIASLQNKLAKRRGQKAPYGGGGKGSMTAGSRTRKVTSY